MNRMTVGLVAGLGGLVIGVLGGHTIWPCISPESSPPHDTSVPPKPTVATASAPAVSQSTFPPTHPADRPSSVDTKKDAELDGLLGELKQSDPDRSFAAAVRLGKLGDVRGASALIEATKPDRELYTRIAASMALGGLKVADAVPALIEMLSEGDDLARQAAGEALEKITLRPPEGMSKVDWTRWWKENEDRVRRSLAERR